MSPAEVWNQGRRQLRPITPETAAMIIGTDGGKERQIRSGMIELRDSEVSGDPLRFDAHLLPPRGKFLTVLNPFDTRRLTCFDARGRYVATLDRLHSVSRADTEGVARSCGRAAKIEAEMLAPMRQRAMRQATKKRAMHVNNARVLDLSRPFTAEEKIADQRRRDNTAPMSAFLEDEAVPDTLQEPNECSARPIASMEDFV